MPFTLAHPSAILPLTRKWPTALLPLTIGSMGPDIPYFLPTRIAEHLPNTHTLAGLLTVATPLALLLYGLLLAARPAVIEPLWGSPRAALDRHLKNRPTSLRAALAVLIATATGCAIHVLWDSFTHGNGWMVQRLPALQHVVFQLAGMPLAVFRLLQYLSSVIGLAVLVCWARRHLRLESMRHPTPPAWRPRVWLGLLLATALASAIAILSAAPRYANFHGRTYIALTTSLGTFVVLYLMVGAIAAWRIRINLTD